MLSFSRYLATLLILVFLAGPLFLEGASLDELRRDLQNQITQKQQEINRYRSTISENRQKAKSLQNEINILEAQINQIWAEIGQIDLLIEQSTLNIKELDGEITGLKGEIDDKKDLLGEYIRAVAIYDNESLLEIVLKKDNFSDFFEEIQSLEVVQGEIYNVLGVLQKLKGDLEEDKENVEGERKEQYRLKNLQLIQKRSVENVQWKKEDLLDRTKGEEQRYQQLIKSAEQEIHYIREQLSLIERYNISLDEAIQEAIYAATRTGIRPAFLLGVLEAESRLGLNVGTGNWREDMYQCYIKIGYISKAEREKNAFLQICQELGLNPDLQPVSAEPWYGCGGAMGVAQFMPTTWMAYRDQVVAITGNNPPSPWRHRDAFMAAAIKLSNGGANQRTEIGERTAYSKYLGGSNYQRWLYSKVTDYVVDLTNRFQAQYFN